MVWRRSSALLSICSVVAICHVIYAAEFPLLGERTTVEYVNSAVQDREQRDEARVVASIPLETEGISLPALDLLVGMDLATQVASYGQRVGGLTEASQAWLIQHAKDVTVSQGVTLQNKAAIVLVTPYDIRAEAERAEDDGYVTMAMEGVISAALESTGTGDLLVLVTIGMSLCPSTAQVVGEMVVSTRGWGGFKTLHIEEFEGIASAINRAMAHIPDHTIVAILTPSFQGPLPISSASREQFQQQANDTRKESATGSSDIYSIYESSRGSTLLLTVDAPVEPQCFEGLRMPALVLDRDTYQALGPLDEGYLFQGGVADYIERARGQGLHEDRPDLGPLLHSPTAFPVCRRAPPSLFDQRTDVVRRVLSGWAAGVDVMSAVLPPADLEYLAQQDMDTFFLTHHLQAWGSCTKAQDGVCVTEGRASAGVDMEYHAQWSGRRITPSLIDEDWRAAEVHIQQGGQRMRVAAVVCVYDDATFLRPLLLDLLAQLDHVVVLVSSVPWRGDMRGHNGHTMTMLGDLLARPELNHDRLSVVKGRWASEAEQRQFGNTLVMSMPGDFTHVMVVDTDEFWHPVELQQALNMVAKRPRSDFPFAASKQYTYWKTLRTVVTPQEPLNKLWLVDPSACRWAHNRELDCSGGNLIYGLATCHHLSYVRTTAELAGKLASFSHADDLQATWFQDKWQAWDNNPSLEDLHPTEPEAYKATTPQPLYLLPPTLRRIYLRHRKALEDRVSGRGQAKAAEVAVVEEHDWMMAFVPPRCDIRQREGGCLFSLSLLDSCNPAEATQAS